ncbi:hypothetical protein BcDW1_10771 [Botrytis cinerea BcDW1]|uniref:Uncharacterized protein n=1 Tax=Botryotinia fuckeliana (strain BcDW1) TaxID=1290391 RepID=M7TB34_BOTF1|nr:hypothetical protein BcDW1_10771 [Botrytis cinerea BcDW1]
MTFNWVDDTNEAVAAGELPDLASDAINLNNSFNDVTDFQVNISGMIDCGISLLKCLFYKKFGIQNMGREMAAKEKVAELEAQAAKSSPDDGKWRVKTQSPLRNVILA